MSVNSQHFKHQKHHKGTINREQTTNLLREQGGRIPAQPNVPLRLTISGPGSAVTEGMMVTECLKGSR